MFSSHYLWKRLIAKLAHPMAFETKFFRSNFDRRRGGGILHMVSGRPVTILAADAGMFGTFKFRCPWFMAIHAGVFTSIADGFGGNFGQSLPSIMSVLAK